jgi:hypothetical protein
MLTSLVACQALPQVAFEPVEQPEIESLSEWDATMQRVKQISQDLLQIQQTRLRSQMVP